MSTLSANETSPSEVWKKTYFWGSTNLRVRLGCLVQLIFCVLRKTSVFCETTFISWGRTPKMEAKSVRGMFFDRLISLSLGFWHWAMNFFEIVQYPSVLLIFSS